MFDLDAIIGGGLSFRQWMREYGVIIEEKSEEKR